MAHPYTYIHTYIHTYIQGSVSLLLPTEQYSKHIDRKTTRKLLKHLWLFSLDFSFEVSEVNQFAVRCDMTCPRQRVLPLPALHKPMYPLLLTAVQGPTWAGRPLRYNYN
jgi:hypothetical protein